MAIIKCKMCGGDINKPDTVFDYYEIDAADLQEVTE